MLLGYDAAGVVEAVGSLRHKVLAQEGLPLVGICNRADRAPSTLDRTVSESEIVPVIRKLAAILSVDVVSYGLLMGGDEEGTLTRLRAHQRSIVDH